MSETYATPSGQSSMNGIERGVPDVPESRKNLVTHLLDEVRKDEKHWERAFKRMKADAAFVRKQLPNEIDGDDRAKVNIVQRHIAQRLAALYAKNPTFIAERRRRLEFAVWDGRRQALESASMEMASGVTSSETMALMADIQEGISRQRMLDKVGKTMEILLQYAMDEQQPPFKPQAKQTVRRALICGVGYAKLAFQRRMDKRPDSEAKLADVTDRIANLERLMADVADKIVDEETSQEVERLRLSREDLVKEPDVVVREGLVFDFPRANSIIPDRATTQLALGFPGARRVSEKFLLTCDEVKEVYGVDIGQAYKRYSVDGASKQSLSDADSRACVYEIYDRKDGLLYVAADGYPDFLKDPAAPPLHYIEPFFPIFPLVFNAVEDEDNIFPDSDVRLLMPIQQEINRKREAARQHRIANRPLYVAPRGALGSETDQKNLGGHAAHEVIELEALADGQKVGDILQAVPKVGVDPNLYETGTDLTDVQLVVGAQEANLGGTSGDSATENSIAENSRLQSVDSNIDDLDDWLSSLARAAGQVLLREMATETVQEVAGPGAIWPELSNQDIAEEVYLRIQAGSSGRPNKAQDLANLERAIPVLTQTPGVSPEWLAKYTLKLLDPHIDLQEAYTEGLPSITSMNRQAQVGTGDPATDPNAQGGQGGENAPAGNPGRGGPQASYQQGPTDTDGGGAPV